MITYPFEVGGLLTRVIEAGSGDRAVVLIHGVGARADRWRHTLEALGANGYHAYALDLPGHGFAYKGKGFDYGVPAYARFLRAFIQAIGPQDVRLVGTSMGGHIAATLVCDHPTRIKELVLVGSMGLVPVGVDRRARIAEAVERADRASIDAKLTTLVFDASQVTREWVLEEHRINTSPGAAESFGALADYFRSSIDEDAIGVRLAGLHLAPPILLVWGRADRYVPLEIGEKAHALLTGSRFAVIDQAGHAPYLERPAVFNQVLIDFLSTHDLRRREQERYVSTPRA